MALQIRGAFLRYSITSLFVLLSIAFSIMQLQKRIDFKALIKEVLKIIFMLGTGILRKLRILKKVNWYKTLYFNFKMFPFSIAKKLPVFFYGSYKFKSLSGNIYIEGAVKTGMIGFGQPYELQTQVLVFLS